MHIKHVSEIMNRFNAGSLWSSGGAGRTLTTLSQQDQFDICDMCHNDLPHGNASHFNSSWDQADAIKLNTLVQPANVGDFNQVWNRTGADANGALVATVYSGNNVNTTSSGCNTIDCHNNKNTTTTAPNDYRWYGANTTGCVMCHVDVPAADLSHVAHLNTSTRASGEDCCRKDLPMRARQRKYDLGGRFARVFANHGAESLLALTLREPQARVDHFGVGCRVTLVETRVHKA